MYAGNTGGANTETTHQQLTAYGWGEQLIWLGGHLRRSHVAEVRTFQFDRKTIKLNKNSNGTQKRFY